MVTSYNEMQKHNTLDSYIDKDKQENKKIVTALKAYLNATLPLEMRYIENLCPKFFDIDDSQFIDRFLIHEEGYKNDSEKRHT